MREGIQSPIMDVLARLARLQRTTNQIDISIGGTSNGGQVRHDVIVVHQAAPKVVSAIVEEFPMGGLNGGGLTIPVYHPETEE